MSQISQTEAYTVVLEETRENGDVTARIVVGFVQTVALIEALRRCVDEMARRAG